MSYVSFDIKCHIMLNEAYNIKVLAPVSSHGRHSARPVINTTWTQILKPIDPILSNKLFTNAKTILEGIRNKQQIYNLAFSLQSTKLASI